MAEPQSTPKQPRVDTESVQSSHKGIKGFFETTLRKFKILVHLLLILPMYLLAGLIFGLSLGPSILFYQWVTEHTANWHPLLNVLAAGFAIGFGFFIYGFSLIFVVPFFNFLLRMNLRPFRGPYYSWDVTKWYIHNGLNYLARYTFLEFITPTPFNNLFYQMMGMKVGKNVQINTTQISDPSLITIGDKATIGGSATIVAHYGQAGYFVLAPVKIGAKSTIGLRSIIMGGVEIGDEAKLLPNSFVLPKTVIPAGETWGGNPAQKVDIKKAISAANSEGESQN